MHNVNGTIIYIGKSKNIKKRLTQHFTSDNRKSKKIQEEIVGVTFEKTGSELLALLKENEEIKRHKPQYNRALRRTKFKSQLSHFTDDKGYINLKIEKADSRKKSITTFSNSLSAKNNLERIVETYNLCQNKASTLSKSANCFNYTIKKCNGACIEEESPESYNDRVMQFINKHSLEEKSMVIVDRGREVDERSFVLVEDGIFKGIGYYNLNFQLNNIDILRSILVTMEDNRDARHIVQSYLRTKKVKKVIPIPEITTS